MMRESDPDFYERALRRVQWIMLALGLLGSVAAASFRGVKSGLAFLLGAAASYLSFWGWRQLAAAITPDSKKPSPAFFILRTLAFVGLAWVIIKFLGLNVAAALAGMLVAAVALFLETIYELIYAS
jgi:hypothetical protein